MADDPKLGTTLLEQGIDGAEDIYNLLVSFMGAQVSVLSATTGTSPITPPNFSAYAVPNSGTSNEFAGQEAKLAIYFNGYKFFSVTEGFRTTVAGSNQIWEHDGTGWRHIAGGFQSLNIAAGSNPYDTRDGHNRRATLNVAATISAFQNTRDGDVYEFLIENLGSGTIAFPAAVEWPGGTAPTLSAGKDLFRFRVIASTIYGEALQNYS